MLEKFLTETLKLAPRQMWGVEQQKIHLHTPLSSKRVQKIPSCPCKVPFTRLKGQKTEKIRKKLRKRQLQPAKIIAKAPTGVILA